MSLILDSYGCHNIGEHSLERDCLTVFKYMKSCLEVCAKEVAVEVMTS